MSRFSRYDTDEERLPDGMTRVGYDADTQVYTFQDSDGSLWESAPGNQYGQLTKVSDGPDPDDYAADTQPFLISDESDSRSSWRREMGPMLNFFVIIGLSLLLLFWYLNWMSHGKNVEKPAIECPELSAAYTIKKGDTCWDIAETHSIKVDDILKANSDLDCDNLIPTTDICLPEPHADS